MFVLNHLFVCDPYLPIVEIPDPICAKEENRNTMKEKLELLFDYFSYFCWMLMTQWATNVHLLLVFLDGSHIRK